MGICSQGHGTESCPTHRDSLRPQHGPLARSKGLSFLERLSGCVCVSVAQCNTGFAVHFIKSVAKKAQTISDSTTELMLGQR